MDYNNWMEITRATFQKLCLLIKNGHVTNSRGQDGVFLINEGSDKQSAKNDLKIFVVNVAVKQKETIDQNLKLTL